MMSFSKVIKIIAISLISLVVLSFFCKDYIVRNAVSYYIKKTFNGECRLKSLNLSFKKISIDNLEISNRYFDLMLRHGQLSFEFSNFLVIKILCFNLKDVDIKINDLASFKKIFSGKNNKILSKKYFFSPFFAVKSFLLDLKDIRFSMEEPSHLAVKTGIDFRGRYIKGSFPKIETLRIPECIIKIKDFETNFKIWKEEEYTLKVFALKVNDKRVEDINISFAIEDNIVFIKSVKSDLLGVKSVLRGELCFKSYNDICLEMAVKDIHFTNIINLFNEDQGIVIKGPFNGDFNVCLEDRKLYQLNGRFHNKSGGELNIKKDASLDFLRRYLTKSSYNSLVDNLKNYLYNNADIEINKDKNKISVDLDFRSENMGRRNLIFNLYDILGVKK